MRDNTPVPADAPLPTRTPVRQDAPAPAERPVRADAPVWTYDDALAWLYGRQALGIKLGLDKVRELLAAVGDPQEAFRSVHVAGTNGKGSVTWFIGEALRRAGHRTGLYTSPHLVRFTERIRIDGAPITESRVAALLGTLRPAVAALDAEDKPPTFFEVCTALAFLHFRAEGAAWAVVETGMGGRLDATNVLRPDACVITNVEDDHAGHLGQGIAAIAREKAGIMKAGIPCVTGATGPSLAILKAVSREHRVPMSVLGEDYHVRPDMNGLRLVHPGGEAHYDVKAAGEHQLDNAALAVAACDALRLAGVAVPIEAVQASLAHTVVPGRLEAFHVASTDLHPDATPRTVRILIDGAHNLAGAQALRWHLGRIDLAGFHLVTGFSADKAWPAMLEQWLPLAARVWGVPLRTPRGIDPARLGEHVAAAGMPFTLAPDVRTALGEAAEAGAADILVAGSLFLVGEARAVLTGESLEEIRGTQ